MKKRLLGMVLAVVFVLGASITTYAGLGGGECMRPAPVPSSIRIIIEPCEPCED